MPFPNALGASYEFAVEVIVVWATEGARESRPDDNAARM
jgi:hypothetical protein